MENNEMSIIRSLTHLNNELRTHQKQMVEKLETRTYTDKELDRLFKLELAVDCFMDETAFNYLAHNFPSCTPNFAIDFASNIDIDYLASHGIDPLVDAPDFLAIAKLTTRDLSKKAS